MLDVEFKPKVIRILKKFKKKDRQFYEQINDTITNIRIDPNIGNVKKGDLSGIWSVDLYNNGINYELSYLIKENDDGQVVLIVLFGTRENYYDELKRYVKFNQKKK